MTSDSHPTRRADALTRSERKDLTRSSLLQAALSLMGEGRSFTSLGIREIAREAGMVPNAFYRHFRNTDELGLPAGVLRPGTMSKGESPCLR